LIIAIPSFDLKIVGKQIKLPEINLSKIGINATLPNLKPGKEIYPSTKYFAKIEFEDTDTPEVKKDTLNKTLEVIKRRLDYSNLYDIKAQAEIKDSSYYVTLIIPGNYPNSKLYADWILNKGDLQVIKFIQDSASTDENAQPQIQSIALKDYQIKRIEKSRNIFVDIDTSQKRTVSIPHLTFIFESDVQNLFQGISPLTANDLQSGVAQVQMYIGSQGYGLYAHESIPNAVRAIPTGNGALESSADVTAFLSLTQSYFMEPESLANTITVQEETESIKPEFNKDGAIFISFTFIVSLILVLLFALRRFGLIKGIALFTTLTTSLLISFVLLKFLQASISTGFIIGFLISAVILGFIIFDLFDNGIKFAEIRGYSLFSIALIVTFVAFSMLQFNMNLVNDITVVIVTSLIGFIFSIQIYLRLIAQTFKINK
jgi:hypothetical protein